VHVPRLYYVNEPETKLHNQTEVSARVARLQGGQARLACQRRVGGKQSTVERSAMLTAADVAVVQHNDQGTMDQVQGDGGRELAGRSPASPVEPLPISNHRHVAAKVV
jgi:hypothetical protein